MSTLLYFASFILLGIAVYPLSIWRFTLAMLAWLGLLCAFLLLVKEEEA